MIPPIFSVFTKLPGLRPGNDRATYMNRLKRTPVRHVELGCFGIELFDDDAIDREQRGYSGSNWSKSWLVIGHDTGTGNPFITDLSKRELPVFTAMHGMGTWSPRPVTSSFEEFETALSLLARLCKDRQNPVMLETNPITQAMLMNFGREVRAAIGTKAAQFWIDFVKASVDILE